LRKCTEKIKLLQDFLILLKKETEFLHYKPILTGTIEYENANNIQGGNHSLQNKFNIENVI